MKDDDLKNRQREAITFTKIATLIIGICNMYCIGAEYQVEGFLDLIYFIVVVGVFLGSLFWILTVISFDINEDKYYMLEAILYILATGAYLVGVICFILSFTRETGLDDSPGAKMVSSILGIVSVLMYGSCSLLIFVVN